MQSQHACVAVDWGLHLSLSNQGGGFINSCVLLFSAAVTCHLLHSMIAVKGHNFPACLQQSFV
jgi:hypothetical protein